MPIKFSYPATDVEIKSLEWKINSCDMRKIPTEWGFTILILFIAVFYLTYAGVIMKSSSFDRSFSNETFYIFLPLILIIIGSILYFRNTSKNKDDFLYGYKIDERGITTNNFKYNVNKFYPWNVFKSFSKKNSEVGALVDFLGPLEKGLYGDIYFIFKKDSGFWFINYITLKTTKDNSSQVEKVISKYIPYHHYNPELSTKKWELDLDKMLKEKLEILYYALIIVSLIIIFGTLLYLFVFF